MVNTYEIVVIGASAGGYDAYSYLLGHLAPGFRLPVAAVQHLAPDSGEYLVRSLNNICPLTVREADEKEPVRPGTVYFAPPNYHLLIESDHSFSLSVDPKVNFCRPSIDVLFESAADVYREALIGVLLTGANADGAKGLKAVKDNGGVTIVQEPSTAEVDAMPRAAIDLFSVDHIAALDQILRLITKLTEDVNA